MNSAGQVIQVPIEDIIPNRFQPRLNFDDNSLQELSASIKEHGVIQPLVLRRNGEKYEIIAGERRYKASMMASLTSVPAIVTQLTDNQSAEVAIVENIQRKNLTAIEEAKSYKTLLDKGYLTQEDLAKKMGVSQSAISNKLRLLTLNDEVQNALGTGKISERHARSLLQINDHDEQLEWLNKILKERLTVKELEKKIKGIPEKEAPIININPNIEEIVKNATDILDYKEVKEPVNMQPQTPQVMPNKFFNPLEDESVNMFSSEPDQEEIELLDFAIPANNTNDISKYNEGIENIQALYDELVQNKLIVSKEEIKTDDEYQITIKIKKNSDK